MNTSLAQESSIQYKFGVIIVMKATSIKGVTGFFGHCEGLSLAERAARKHFEK